MAHLNAPYMAEIFNGGDANPLASRTGHKRAPALSAAPPECRRGHQVAAAKCT